MISASNDRMLIRFGLRLINTDMRLPPAPSAWWLACSLASTCARCPTWQACGRACARCCSACRCARRGRAAAAAPRTATASGSDASLASCVAVRFAVRTPRKVMCLDLSAGPGVGALTAHAVVVKWQCACVDGIVCTPAADLSPFEPVTSACFCIILNEAQQGLVMLQLEFSCQGIAAGCVWPLCIANVTRALSAPRCRPACTRSQPGAGPPDGSTSP
jgi:hypothetical protein